MNDIIWNFIFLILGASFFCLSQIFLLVQGAKNYKFFRFNDDEIIIERTLFEQFSEEVYESINTPLMSYTFKNSCSISDQIYISLNLDTYFDCTDLYTSDLREECQNNIVPNYTDCTPGTSNNNFNFNYNRDFLNYEYRIVNDPRISYCEYFSKYTQKISKLDDKYICKDSYEYSYDNLLYNSVPLKDINGMYNNCPSGTNNCGILDTKNNILCLNSNWNCPNNYFYERSSSSSSTIKLYNRFIQGSFEYDKPIIISVIISENRPMIHEWKTYVKELYNDLDDEEIKKRRSLTKKIFRLIGKEEDDTYQKLDISVYTKNITESNYIKNYQSGKYYNDQLLNIYTRNYIGFKNSEELNDFKSIFNEKDPMDNPLYKLSSSGHNPIITITFSTVFLFLDLVNIFFIIFCFKKGNNYNPTIIKIFIAINSVFFLVELFIIAFHFYKYPKINIDMDDRMKKVLDLYNDRTFNFQVYRIISVVFSFVSLSLTSIIFYKNVHIIPNRSID